MNPSSDRQPSTINHQRIQLLPRIPNDWHAQRRNLVFDFHSRYRAIAEHDQMMRAGAVKMPLRVRRLLARLQKTSEANEKCLGFVHRDHKLLTFDVDNY